MEYEQRLVAGFHRQIGVSIRESAQLLDCEPEVDADFARSLRQLIESYCHDERQKSELLFRALMAIEEFAEWIEAHVAGDLIEAADAWADRAYVLMGDAVAAGLPAEALFAEVHRSNMTKAPASKETSKGVKSANFIPPRIAELLQKTASRENTMTGPQIGIWWDNGSKIVSFAHAPGEADRFTGLCDSDFTHNDLWRKAAKQFGLSEFREYFSIPRGRVLWSPSKTIGVIYHGNATSQHRLEAIAKEFSLAAWKAQTDSHYMMGGEIDELFDD